MRPRNEYQAIVLRSASGQILDLKFTEGRGPEGALIPILPIGEVSRDSEGMNWVGGRNCLEAEYEPYPTITS